MLFGLFHRKPRTREELDAYNERKRLHLDIKHAKRVWKEIKRDYRNRFVWGSGQQSLYLQQDDKAIVVYDAEGNPRGTMHGFSQDTPPRTHLAPLDNHSPVAAQHIPNTGSPLPQATPTVQDGALPYQFTVIPPRSPQLVAASVRPDERSPMHSPNSNELELPHLPVDQRSPGLSPLSSEFTPLNTLPRAAVPLGPPVSDETSPSRWLLQPVNPDLLQQIRIPITLDQRATLLASSYHSPSTPGLEHQSLTPQPPSVHNETLQPIPPVPIIPSKPASLATPSISTGESGHQQVESWLSNSAQGRPISRQYAGGTSLGLSDTPLQSAHAQLDGPHHHDGIPHPSEAPSHPPGLFTTLRIRGREPSLYHPSRVQGVPGAVNHPEVGTPQRSQGITLGSVQGQSPAIRTPAVNSAESSDCATLGAWNLTMCDMLLTVVRAWDLGNWLMGGIPTEGELHEWAQARFTLIRVLLCLRTALGAISDLTPPQALRNLRVYLQEQCYEMHRPLQTLEEQTQFFRVVTQGVEVAVAAMQNSLPPTDSQTAPHGSIRSRGNSNQGETYTTNRLAQPANPPVHGTVTNDGTLFPPQNAVPVAQVNPGGPPLHPPPVIFTGNDIWRFDETTMGDSNNPPAETGEPGTYGCRYMGLHMSDDEIPLAQMDLVRTPRNPILDHSPLDGALYSRFHNVTSRFAHPRPERNYDLTSVVQFSPTIAGNVGLRSPRLMGVGPGMNTFASWTKL